MMTDLDELITPYRASSLTSMLAELQGLTLTQAGRPLPPAQVHNTILHIIYFGARQHAARP